MIEPELLSQKLHFKVEWAIEKIAAYTKRLVKAKEQCLAEMVRKSATMQSPLSSKDIKRNPYVGSADVATSVQHMDCVESDCEEESRICNDQRC